MSCMRVCCRLIPNDDHIWYLAKSPERKCEVLFDTIFVTRSRHLIRREPQKSTSQKQRATLAGLSDAHRSAFLIFFIRDDPTVKCARF